MKIKPTEYKHRINALKAKVGTSHLDAFIVSEEEDIYYYTGLTYKSLERLFLLIIKENEVSFIVPKMELAHLKSVENVNQFITYFEYPAQKSERWEDALLQSIENCPTIGMGSKTPFEIAHFLRASNFDVQLSDLVEVQRWVKSPAEIELIKQAAKYCDISIEKLNNSVYYGMTELEVFSLGRTIQQMVIKETPFDYLATNILIAAWPSRIGHQPHGVPKVEDVLIEGTHISLSFLRVNGYSAELERTFFTAQPSPEQVKYFEIMMEARRRALAVLKAGVVAEVVDLAVKDFFIENGLKDNILHRTGHGIGIGNHEGPYLAEGDKTILQENMVVSIEPGIYIEGVGGFRHSDTVRITKEGYEILTHCPTDIRSLTFLKSRPFQKLKGVIIKKIFNIKGTGKK